jgi:hypothetical protein
LALQRLYYFDATAKSHEKTLWSKPNKKNWIKDIETSRKSQNTLTFFESRNYIIQSSFVLLSFHLLASSIDIAQGRKRVTVAETKKVLDEN